MTNPAPAPSKMAFWIGWILGVVPVALLLFSASMKFMMNEEAAKGFAHLGWPTNLAMTLGILELSCAVLYLIPQTAVLGAILITGYMGGAIATHLRIGEPVYIQVLLPIVIWIGLYLRDPRLRRLAPLRASN